MPTDIYLTEEALWASGLASRLRMIQATFADDAPATRQNYLAEEIERALKDVSPSRRKTFLEALAERFPAWQAPTAGAPEPAAAVPAETPEALLARLVEVAPSLSPEVKEKFAKHLQQAGLMAKPAAEQPLEIPPELQKKLGIPEGKPVNPERALKLLAAVSEMVIAMEQLAWALWKQVAPMSNIRKEGDFLHLAGPYLAGDTEVSTQQLIHLLERVRRLLASLMGAIGRGGATYARKHVAQFAPDVIEDLAKIEKKAWESLDAVSWRKYAQLAREYDSEPVIENEIQKAIAKAAENLMVGRNMS